MSFHFRPAVRENVSLLIGLAGGTGSGKTYTAMTLAKGLSGGKPFAVIDTEAGRAKHYADLFRFDHGDLGPPFRPAAYADAIKAADEAGYPVIVVDSASHEHAGEGGLLDFHEDELARMAGDDWKKREAVKMAAWIKPKTEHKRMVQRLLQVRAHLILCFRAEEKVDIVKGEDGRTKIVPKKSLTGLDGWVPICEKNLPYELTASFLLVADEPGVGRPIKLQAQHRPFFPSGQPIGEEAGVKLAAWARGGAAPEAPASAVATPPTAGEGDPQQELLDAIAAMTAGWKRRPTEAEWRALCEAECGASDLARVDPSRLDEFLRLLKKLAEGDGEARARVTRGLKGRAA